ncbi:uncharacterized protein DSM5745_05142 [Aspergillus mulundensis]|uniref:F-box domain-containing protein n=1 Tax=Aspergillus mulundensis TaxID=1810919 RepID=A0A3D8S5J6_9EURO|nr:hypothetical protein DSM5745_05142 [Aspergillus mulundensis]RDW81585.1 hypothetical protein DSM5745_05142 [Aspergillus mulundensis]
MSLERLPVELIWMIADETDSKADVLALAMTSKRLSSILIRRLIKLNIKSHHSSGLAWAVMHNNLALAKTYLDSGAKQQINDEVVVWKCQRRRCREYTLREHCPKCFNRKRRTRKATCKKPLQWAVKRGCRTLPALVPQASTLTRLGLAAPRAKAS